MVLKKIKKVLRYLLKRGKIMKLEFGKYTDITNFAKKVNPEMFKIYQKVYITGKLFLVLVYLQF